MLINATFWSVLMKKKFLGVHLDSGLSFDYHIPEICKKASRKVCALSRVTSGMSLSTKHTLMNAFFKSQFNYCPLIWICHSRENNNILFYFMKGV